MNFLANENFPFPSIKVLEKYGHKVRSISKEFQGIPDIEVINIAIRNKLVILTFDKDYGEIIFKNKLKNPPPVIFYRYKGPSTTFAGDILISLIEENHINFEYCLTVIEEFNLRQRKY